MTNDIINSAEMKMKKSISSLQTDLSKMRTGRAHPSLIEHVMVSYYGQETPLGRVGNIGVEDARTLTVTLWDKSMVSAVEKAILTADLGLNPATAGTVIRIPLPPLTEERRKEMVKLIKSEGENARVAVRNIRRDAMAQVKDLLKDKQISEDDQRRADDQIQKLTDQYVKNIDKLLTDKETDLMTI